MQKRYEFLAVTIAAIGLILGGTALVSQAAPAGNGQGSNRQAPKPVSATNVKIFKKIPLPLDETKQIKKPVTPPGKDKIKEEGAATGILGETLGDGAKKYAIVIGICDYPGADYDLCVSDGDSLHTYKALVENYGYDPDNITLLKDTGGAAGDNLGNVVYGVPSRNNIYNAIAEIRDKAVAGDEVAFFFSGHGTNANAEDGDEEITDEGIVVWGSENPEGNIDFIWDGELRTEFSGFLTNRIAFVFDSCLAGGMNDVAGEGRIVSMATQETKSAYVYSTAGEDVDGDGTPDGEGVFSHYFANEGMLQGLADAYDHVQGIADVTVEEAFDYAKNNILPYLKNRQKPVMSDGFAGDLLF